MQSPLPTGFKPTEDETIVFHLLKDELFRESIESEYGKLLHIYADWHADHLVYDFLNGTSKYSVLSEIIKTLKDLGYLKDLLH